MVVASTQAKLFDACSYHRLLPAASPSPRPSSLLRSWYRPLPWSWDDWEEGRRSRRRRKGTKNKQSLGPRVHCAPLQQQQSQAHQQRQEAEQVLEEDVGIMCEPCNGRGWLLCDFCKGQKTNVKAENNNRIYRRCPSCRAIGYILCSNCKVFKCVTFPDDGDGEM